MAENNFGKGIKITSGFDLGAKSPLDNRSVVNTLEERDAHVTNNRAYEGMKVYVAETKKEYIFIDNEWVSASSQEEIEAIIDLEKIETSDIEPVDETVSIWINTSEDTTTGTAAKINDEVISGGTTWSSEKINASIVSGGSSGTVDLSGYALKTELPTKVSQLTNDKNYITSIPSEYITEQELAETNSSIQKLNEQYDNLLIRHNELSNVVDGLDDKNDVIATLEAQCSTLFTEQNELSGKIDVLEEDNEELKGQYNELLTNQNELLGKVENLEGNETIEELRGQYNELSASHNELGTRFNELLAQVGTLESDNERINNLYNNLTIGHNELLERHNELSTKHTSLSKKYDTLTEEFNSLKNVSVGELTEKFNLLSIKYETLLERIEALEDGSSGGITVIPCTSITLNKTSLSFDTAGSTGTLIATVTPSNCTEPIVWSSSKSTVAMVNNGTVIALANGSCVITATCGNYSVSCNVSVNIQEVPTVIPCTGITLDKTSLSFASNMAQSLTATVVPANTTDSIVWTSSKNTIATVLNGIVTPIANGNCIITATCGNYSANCSITVNIQSTVVTYAITNNLTNVTTDNPINTIQENQPYSAILTYPDNYELSQIRVLMNNVDITNSVVSDYNSGGTTIPCTSISLNETSITFTDNSTKKLIATLLPSNTTDSVVWTSNNNDIATVDNTGLVTPISYGTCMITAICGNCSAICNISVNIQSPVVTDGITLNPTSMTLTERYSSEVITATLTGNLVGSTVTWVSSDTTVASVTNGGKVTALANGTCIITATCGSKSATCSVTVNIGDTGGDTGTTTNTLTINPSSLTFTKKNETATLALGYNGEAVLGYSAKWISSNSTAVYVDSSGTVMALANGSSTVTASYSGLTASCTITVNIDETTEPEEPTNISCTSVSLSETSIYFIDNTPKSLVATLTPSNTTDTVTWTSSGDTIATVSNAGIVTPIADGTCTITVTCGSYSATCSVTVNMNNSGGESGESTVYTNPTITYDSTMYKAKLTQDGYTEYIDVSYIKNTGHADYSNYKTITDSNSQTHYLALLEPTSTSAISKFRVNGLIPDTGGWFNRSGGYDEDGLYNLWLDPRIHYGTNFSTTIKNNGLSTDYFNKSLAIFNSMFPALNLTESSSSSNEIVQLSTCEWGDDYLGMTWAGAGYEDGFHIEIYSTALTQYGGSYSSDPNYWISVAVHELGHTLGLDDYPSHSPTIYNYNEDHSNCWYQQPNDVYAFKTLAKEQFDIDIVTALEQSCGTRYNTEGLGMKIENTSTGGVRCTYITHNNPEEKSDIVVEAKLTFVRDEVCIPSNGGRGAMHFDVYTIEPLNIIKGEDLLQINNEVRIPKNSGINVDINNNYRLCLRTKENNPHLLLNPSQGINKIN